MTKKGKFIAFEGIDGSGKSTQVAILADKLRDSGYKVHVTCEPTDSPIGSVIHQIMSGRIISDDKTIAGLFVADRLDHLQNPVNGICKKIDEGYIVLTDRYYFSSYAYHGIHMPLDWVINANSLSANILRPNINIYIDILPEVGLQRLNSKRFQLELYENLENLRKVREKYLESFEFLKNEEKIIVIDGSLQENLISDLIWETICNIL